MSVTKILNPATGRMVSISGAIGKKLLKLQQAEQHVKPDDQSKKLKKPSKPKSVDEGWLRSLVDGVKKKFASLLKKTVKGERQSMITINLNEQEGTKSVKIQLMFNNSVLSKGKLIKYKEDSKKTIYFKDVSKAPSSQIKKMIAFITKTKFVTATIEYVPFHYIYEADKMMPYDDFNKYYETKSDVSKFKDMFAAVDITIDWKNWVEKPYDEDDDIEVTIYDKPNAKNKMS